MKGEKSKEQSNKRPTNYLVFLRSVYIAYDANTTLFELFYSLRGNFAKIDEEIVKIEPEFGPFRVGDIPHLQASILKAKTIFDYNPKSNF